MGMNLAASIPDGATVLLDTNPVVYLLENHALAEKFWPIFEDIDAGRIQALITPITLAEVLVGPLKAGKETLAERYRHALTENAGWTVRDIDSEIAMLAARLRVKHK